MKRHHLALLLILSATAACNLPGRGREPAPEDPTVDEAPTITLTGDLLSTHQTATASASLPGYAPERAIDGDLSTGWQSGGLPRQWLALDFDPPVTVSGIRVTVDQATPGETRIEVWARGLEGPFQVIQRFSGQAGQGTVFAANLDAPREGITALRIETVSGPAEVGYLEIEVFGTSDGSAAEAPPGPVEVDPLPVPEGPPTLILHNAQVITMNDDQPDAQAIALVDDRILAVGSDDDILALQNETTQVIDVQGRTIMPGFVDPHTHLFNDSAQFGTDFDGIQQRAIEVGITTLANLYSPPDFHDQMVNYAAAGGLRIRTSLYLNYNTNCGDPIGEWYLDMPPTREPGEMLRVGGVKVFTDGGSCGSPAFSYEHPAFGMGDLWMPQEELDSVVANAQAVGHQVAIHAIGDRAIDEALNAIEAAQGGGPNIYRHRIEHNAVIRDDQLARYSEVDPVALIFGTFPSCGNPFAVSPPEYQHWEWRWRDFVDANPDLHIAWHGDDPSIPPISPLLELYSLVTPSEVGSEDGSLVCPDATHIANKTLTVEEVLPMMTIEAAYALWRDSEVGSLTPGKFADLLILSDNPTTAQPEAIRNIQVTVTLIGGRTEFCRAGQEVYCP